MQGSFYSNVYRDDELLIGKKSSWIGSSPELLRKLQTPVPEHEWSLSLSDVWVCFWFDFAPSAICCLHIWTKWKQWTTKCTQQVSTVPPPNYIYYCFFLLSPPTFQSAVLFFSFICPYIKYVYSCRCKRKKKLKG